MFTKTAMLILCIAAVSAAGPVVTVIPPGGSVAGLPGTTVGWGLSVLPDPVEWVTFIGSVLVDESNQAGDYFDLIGAIGGPDSGVLAPGGPQWLLDFNESLGEGLGGYAINSVASPRLDELTVRLLYERYSGDPLTCGDCFLASGQTDLPLELRVAGDEPAPAPEPAGAFVAGLLLLAAASAVRRREAR